MTPVSFYAPGGCPVHDENMCTWCSCSVSFSSQLLPPSPPTGVCPGWTVTIWMKLLRQHMPPEHPHLALGPFQPARHSITLASYRAPQTIGQIVHNLQSPIFLGLVTVATPGHPHQHHRYRQFPLTLCNTYNTSKNSNSNATVFNERILLFILKLLLWGASILFDQFSSI